MSQAQIGNLQVALGLNTAQFSAGVAQAQSSLGRLSGALKGFAAAAAGALSLGVVASSLKATADRMDALGKAAQKIGIPVDQLSKLEYAGKLADVSLDTLTTTLAKFSKNIAEVAAGGKNDVGAALTALGISATDANGKLRPTIEIISDVAEEFSVMRDGAGKTALSIALFTKSGADMIPLLNGGRDAIASAGQELERFGGVVTPEAAKQAESFNDNLTRLQTAFDSLLQQAIAPMLPSLIELTERMITLAQTSMPVGEWVNSLIAWFAELKPFIESTRREIELITQALQYLGLVDPAPLEIDIPGADLAVAEGKGDKQVKDAPALPVKPEKAKSSPVPKIPYDSPDDIYGYGEAFSDLWERMADGIPTTDALTESFQDMADTVANTLSNALVGLINGTMSVKDAFKSMAQSISQQLSELAAQLIKSAIFKFISMGFGSMGGVTVGGMSFGGFYADGGHLGSGKWGIAGENGPEIIRGPANITPMDRMGGGSPQMNVTVINNSSAQVNTRQNSKGELEVLVEEIMADKALRGGNKFDSALQRGYGLRRAGR